MALSIYRMDNLLTSAALQTFIVFHYVNDTYLTKSKFRPIRTFSWIVKACLAGFWFAVLSKKACYLLTEKFYSWCPLYNNENYNKEGLFPSQKNAVDQFFGDIKSILVAGAGGGKEMLALEKMGFIVDGFECNSKLVVFGNRLLKNEGCRARIERVEPDNGPTESKVYDAIIIGAGVIINIHPRERRINFLKELQSHLPQNGPILVGYCQRDEHKLYFDIVYRIGNFMRILLFRDRLTLGDTLQPAYEHHFTNREIQSELESAGFAVTYFDNDVTNFSQVLAHRT